MREALGEAHLESAPLYIQEHQAFQDNFPSSWKHQPQAQQCSCMLCAHICFPWRVYYKSMGLVWQGQKLHSRDWGSNRLNHENIFPGYVICSPQSSMFQWHMAHSAWAATPDQVLPLASPVSRQVGTSHPNCLMPWGTPPTSSEGYDKMLQEEDQVRGR